MAAPRYFLDTNTCIYIINRNPPHVAQIFQRYQIGNIAVSGVTVAELAFGVAKSTRRGTRDALEEFLLDLVTVPYDDAAVWVYGEIRAGLQATGKPIGPLDLLIAAHADAKAKVEAMMAEEMQKATAGLNQRQRDGLYDMARRFIGLLEERTYAMSVVPPVRVDLSTEDYEDTDIGQVQYPHAMPEFVIDDFVAGTDTLYALSKEGPDSSAALTTALALSSKVSPPSVSRRHAPQTRPRSSISASAATRLAQTAPNACAAAVTTSVMRASSSWQSP